VVTPFQPTEDDDVHVVVRKRNKQIGFIYQDGISNGMSQRTRKTVSTKQVDLFSQYPTS